MDAISLILAALSAGAGALAKGLLDETAKDLYGRLKSNISKRLKNSKQNENLIAQYETDSDTWEKPLKKAMLSSSVDRDDEVLRLAEKLIKILDSQNLQPKSNINVGQISGGYVNFGEKQVIQNGTNQYIENLTIGESTAPAEIREIILDLKQNDGTYPVLHWYEEADDGILFAKGPQVTRQWWSPESYSSEYLKGKLMDEINKWTSQAWEVIETNYDELWEVEHLYNETKMSTFTNLLGMSVGRTWKHQLTFFKAHFHIRRSIVQ